MSDENHTLTATMLGYVSGIADHGENPYHYVQAEAWCWEHGREQGRRHRVNCIVRDKPSDRKSTTRKQQ